MFKLRSLMLIAGTSLAISGVYADDNSTEGYIGTPNQGSGTVIRTTYGCVHSTSYVNENSKNFCNDADLVPVTSSKTTSSSDE